MDEQELQRIADDLSKKNRPDPEEEAKRILKMEKPTEEQKEKAEQLLRQLMLAKQRDQKSVVTKLLEELQGVAPNYAPVQEAIGDDFVERRQFRRAKETYLLAKKLDPESVSIENKYGEMVLKVDLHIDPATYNDAGTMASGKIAVILSAFLPGLGHFVLGHQITGVGFMVSTVICWILTLLPGGLQGLLGMLGVIQTNQPLNMLTVVGVIGLVATYLIAISTASSLAKRLTPTKIDRPKPPSDKDFE